MPTHGECSDKQEHLRPIKKHPNHSKYLQITNCGVALPSLSPSSSLAFRQVGLLPTFSVLFSLRVRIHVYPTLVRSQSHMFLYSMSHCAYVQIYIYIIIYTYYVCVYLFPGSEESHSHTKPPPAHLRAYQRFLCRHPSLPAPAASS